MRFINIITFLILFSAMLSGCNFINPDLFRPKCESHVPQKYKFGYQEAEIRTTSKTMKIGDTIFIRTHINQDFMDSLSGKPVAVRERVSLLFRLTTAFTAVSSSPFALDTTIYRVFDQYFDTVLRTGKRIDVYRFDAVNTNGYWDLDLIFIAKKKGSYEIYPWLERALTGEKLPDRVCMLGDAEKFQGMLRIKATNNRIGEIYPVLTRDYENHFGFIVE